MHVQDQDWHLRTRSELDGARDDFGQLRPPVNQQRSSNEGRNWWIGAAVVSALIAAAVLLVFKFVFRGLLA